MPDKDKKDKYDKQDKKDEHDKQDKQPKQDKQDKQPKQDKQDKQPKQDKQDKQPKQDKPDKSEPEVALSEPDATLLEQLSQLGVDLDQKRIIEYGFVASSVSDAEALSLCLQGIGHEFVDLPDQLDQETNCEDRAGVWIESCELISPIDAARKTQRLQLLASEFHCKYDGWGTCIDNSSAE